jgi:hypothetical protein
LPPNSPLPAPDGMRCGSGASRHLQYEN